MAMQEFLASFAVEIDESGVRRLQEILEENRELAESLATAFQAAKSALAEFVSEAADVELPFENLFSRQGDVEQPSENLFSQRGNIEQPSENQVSRRGEAERQGKVATEAISGAVASFNEEVVLPVSLDLSKANQELQAFKNSDAMRLRLTGDASAVAAAANTALDSIKEAYSGTTLSINEEVVLPVSLDLSKANQELRAFKNSDVTRLRLTGDASAVVAAANTALASIKAAYSGTTLSISAKIDTPAGVPASAGGGAAASAGNGASGNATQAAPSGTVVSGSGLLRSSTGGRFTRSTTTEVAEDGQTEYIIPIQKETIAVPLIRQMMGEMSDSAKEAVMPDFSGISVNLGTLDAPTVNTSAGANVQAPVNITVNAGAMQAEAVGRSVYDLAERYLLRTLKGATS